MKEEYTDAGFRCWECLDRSRHSRMGCALSKMPTRTIFVGGFNALLRKASIKYMTLAVRTVTNATASSTTLRSSRGLLTE